MMATALPDNLNSNQTSHKVDTTRPTITGLSITSTGPYKSGDVITLQATFSEAVTISTGTAAGIPLTIGTNSRAATAAANSTADTTFNFSYTVAGSDSDSDGIVVATNAEFANPGRIADLAGNAMDRHSLTR